MYFVKLLTRVNVLHVFNNICIIINILLEIHVKNSLVKLLTNNNSYCSHISQIYINIA